jgi:hypothetical protein
MTAICEMHTGTGLNLSQNVFVVFYAIFWGAIFNVQSRWKSFQLPLFLRFKVATHRVILSFFILNILPILYFLWIFYLLSKLPDIKIWNLALSSILPSLGGTMGLYRLWLGFIELFPHQFYKFNKAEIPEKFRKVEPVVSYRMKKEDPVIYIGDKKSGILNIIWALIYIIIFGFLPIIYLVIANN